MAAQGIPRFTMTWAIFTGLTLGELSSADMRTADRERHSAVGNLGLDNTTPVVFDVGER